MRRILIGVMGPGDQATPEQIETAFALGKGLAEQGWVVLTGGRNAGVMEAACRGAQAGGGLTIGILPTENVTALSAAVDIPILTGLGSARNNVNVLTSQVVIACGLGAGTASEIALAIKAHKPVILMQVAPEVQAFFQTLSAQPVSLVTTVEGAIAQIQQHLALS